MFLVCTCVWNSLNASSQRRSFYDTRRHHPSWYRREANISLTNFWLLAEGSECSLTAHIVTLLIRHLKTQLKLDYRVGSYIIQCDFIFIREEDAKKPLEETQSSACEAICMWRRDSSEGPNPLKLWYQASAFQTPGKPTFAMQASQSLFC